jgi:hypothetical protein
MRQGNFVIDPKLEPDNLADERVSMPGVRRQARIRRNPPDPDQLARLHHRVYDGHTAAIGRDGRWL